MRLFVDRPEDALQVDDVGAVLRRELLSGSAIARRILSSSGISQPSQASAYPSMSPMAEATSSWSSGPAFAGSGTS